MTELQGQLIIERLEWAVSALHTLAFVGRLGVTAVGVLIGFKAMQFMRDAAGMPHFWGPRS